MLLADWNSKLWTVVLLVSLQFSELAQHVARVEKTMQLRPDNIGQVSRIYPNIDIKLPHKKIKLSHDARKPVFGVSDQV